MTDCPLPDQMPAWLRETAANTRAHTEDPTSGYVALRLDQAAEMIERLRVYTDECCRRGNQHVAENALLRAEVKRAYDEGHRDGALGVTELPEKYR